MTTEKQAQDPIAGKTVAEIFGEIVWLMTQNEQAKEMPIKELERLVMPPIMLRQFHITYAPVAAPNISGRSQEGPEPQTILQPVAVELFALEREAKDFDPAMPLLIPPTPAAWRSGTKKRVVFSLSNVPAHYVQ
ncbi:toxin-activating lysine-acyltransferase [Agrobacterium cavarae]